MTYEEALKKMAAAFSAAADYDQNFELLNEEEALKAAADAIDLRGLLEKKATLVRSGASVLNPYVIKY